MLRMTQGGFMAGEPIWQGDLPPSLPLISRFQGTVNALEADPKLNEALERIKRGEFEGDINQILAQFSLTMQGIGRAISSATPNLPIRENLEQEVQMLVPQDTPFRNMFPRRVGAGRAVNWRQITSLGGGWGTSGVQGGGGSAQRVFFGETGAPAELSTVYANKVASYKLMGSMGAVTGFGMAAGANFMDQYATERTHSIMNLMLNEENAIINGDASSVVAPWGDGTNALAFDGLINLFTTANGVPSAHIQAGVGALTTAHIDAQLRRVWEQGGKRMWMGVSTQEATSLVHLAEASGSLIRIPTTGANNKVNLGLIIGGYVHPISGEVVDIVVNRFIPAGTMLFGAQAGPTGQPIIEIEVLPQVQLPQLAPNAMVQGYVAQEIAPEKSAPQVYSWLVSVYEVLKLKNALVVAKSTGVTAV